MDTIKHTIGKLLKRAFIWYQSEVYRMKLHYFFPKSWWHPSLLRYIIVLVFGERVWGRVEREGWGGRGRGEGWDRVREEWGRGGGEVKGWRRGEGVEERGREEKGWRRGGEIYSGKGWGRGGGVA